MKYYFRCPKCGNDEQFVKPTEAPTLFAFNPVAGLPFAGYAANRVQCAKCLHLFQRPPVPNSPLATFAYWIMALIIIPMVVAVFLLGVDNPDFSLPPLAFLSLLEAAIKAHPRVAAYLFVLLLGLIPVLCWIAALVSNASRRRELRKVYRFHAVSPRRVRAGKSAEAGDPGGEPARLICRADTHTKRSMSEVVVWLKIPVPDHASAQSAIGRR